MIIYSLPDQCWWSPLTTLTFFCHFKPITHEIPFFLAYFHFCYLKEFAISHLRLCFFFSDNFYVKQHNSRGRFLRLHWGLPSPSSAQKSPSSCEIIFFSIKVISIFLYNITYIYTSADYIIYYIFYQFVQYFCNLFFKA